MRRALVRGGELRGPVLARRDRDRADPRVVGAFDVPRRVADEGDLGQRRVAGAAPGEHYQVRSILRLATEGAGARREEAVEAQARHSCARDQLPDSSEGRGRGFVPARQASRPCGAPPASEGSACARGAGRRAPRTRAPTSEPGVDRGALEAFAEQEVAEALHRCLARPVIGACEALLGQLVAQTSRTLSTSAST